MQMYKKFAGNQNQSYRLVIKTIITEGANMSPVKTCV